MCKTEVTKTAVTNTGTHALCSYITLISLKQNKHLNLFLPNQQLLAEYKAQHLLYTQRLEHQQRMKIKPFIENSTTKQNNL